jgi:hypothetical protein
MGGVVPALWRPTSVWHGTLRKTCCTSVTMRLEIYAHALPSMHQEATQKLARWLEL